MRHALILILYTSTLATTTSAGGLSDPVIVPPAAPIPTPAPAYDFYVGAQLGFGTGDVAPNDPSTIFREFDIEGPFHGVHAGVQRDFGPLTLGVEVDYTSSSGDLEEDDNPSAFIDVDTLAHLKLRAGTNIGSTLVYGTAGLAHAAITIEQGIDKIELEDNAPFYGIGADFMVNENFSIGAEYLVHSFEDMEGSDTDFDLNTAMLRVSYHF
ncbi:outer membrane beta-barrel protein [Yoonia sp. GPGPB17]|uniref:outer membrane protein n=1 Tax=Yoonia sp. GPGPB17 TaxID=3026147 RepID=UPI0030C44B4B